MAGQHIEREARVTQTGLTSVQRDQLIWKLHHAGRSQRQIATQVGLTQPAVKYAIDRLSGKTRNRSTYEVCDDCGETFPTSQLNRDGFCFGTGTNRCADTAGD